MQNIIKISVLNKQELSEMYIKPFKHGGLLIAGNFNYQLGTEVYLLVCLPGDNEPLTIRGKVAWLSPETSIGYLPGIGVHFNHDPVGAAAKKLIEDMLDGYLAKKVARDDVF